MAGHNCLLGGASPGLRRLGGTAQHRDAALTLSTQPSVSSPRPPESEVTFSKAAFDKMCKGKLCC